MKLIKGATYTPEAINAIADMTIGWTGADQHPEGYNVYDYFDFEGRYLGPDSYGVEPILRA